jgi:SAM-dependent methyltransferase
MKSARTASIPHEGRDLEADYGRARLLRCRHCGLVFSDLYQEGFDPKALYQDFYKNEIPVRFASGLEPILKLFRLYRAFKVATTAARSRTVLDIGCGTGYLLYFLKKFFGYRRTAGTQLSEKAYLYARDRLGLEVHFSDLLDLPLEDRSFDLITVFHVLEHVVNPEAYLSRSRRLLRKGGWLFIEVPNFQSWSRVLTGRYWLGLDLAHHLHFFTPRTLTSLLGKLGFSVRRVHTFSLEYSTFISVQSLVSLLTGTDGLIFEGLETGRFDARLIFHGLLFLLLAPFCLLVNLALYFTRRGEVLFIAAQNG